MRIFVDSTRRKSIILIENDNSYVIREFDFFSDVPQFLVDYIGRNGGFESIEVVGITIGPGSFTGIRNVIGFFKAWKIIKGIDVRGYNSLLSISRYYDGRTVVMPSRKGRVFVGKYPHMEGKEVKIERIKEIIGDDIVVLTDAIEGIEGNIDSYGIVKGMSRWYMDDGNYSLSLEPFYLHE